MHYMTSTIGTDTEWHELRNSFHHDWLKNIYLVKLGHFVNILDEHIEDDGFEVVFLRTVFPQWNERRDQAIWLASNFEHFVSPFISSLSFENETLEFAVGFSQKLWRSRNLIESRVERIISHVGKVDYLYERIHSESSGDQLGFPHQMEGRELFRLFRGTCVELSKAISDLPPTLRIV